MSVTDEQLQPAADFYGITLEEARRRWDTCQAQGDNPEDPICIGCAKRPEELIEYVEACMESADDELPSTEEVRQYVINEEGTYNPSNGHYLCTDCYIRNGQPSNDRGWVCP